MLINNHGCGFNEFSLKFFFQKNRNKNKKEPIMIHAFILPPVSYLKFFTIKILTVKILKISEVSLQ